MPHAREQIRAAIVAQVTGLATTGSAVSTARVYAHATLPSLVVTTPAEQVVAETDTLGKRHLRQLTVHIEARAKETAEVHNTLDDICAEVETALADDPTLGARTQYLELLSTELDYEDDAEQPTGLARMIWEAAYAVEADDPTTLVYV